MAKAKKYAGLRPIQIEAINLILTGLSWTEVAEKLDVKPDTLLNWRTKNVLFQTQLLRAQEALFVEVGLKHKEYLTTGLDFLVSQIKSTDDRVSEAIKQQSAVSLVELIHSNIEVIKVLEQNKNSLREYYQYLKHYFDNEDNPENYE